MAIGVAANSDSTVLVLFVFLFISKAGLVNKMLLILEINEKFYLSFVEPGLSSLQENLALRHGYIKTRSRSELRLFL